MDSAAMVPDRGRSFTWRAVAAGLAVGLVICFSNMYFGLQTGWVSIMSMPSSLLGFGIFKALSPHLHFPFSPVENVLVQTVAGSMAIMPLGCGFVGILPAMNYLLAPEEQGPLDLSLWKMIIWSLGLCYFGVVFAVPLRRQFIIRERLRFPSGFSTAVLIGVLHGKTRQSRPGEAGVPTSGGFASLVPDEDEPGRPPSRGSTTGEPAVPLLGGEPEGGSLKAHGWADNVKLLALCFLVSGIFTLSTYFLPVLRNIPIFGHAAAEWWLWTFNPSLAYFGQGIIMGPETTLHMLLGAIVGWAILSPLAKYRGWAPGPIDDWETGSKGWIVWISLAVMLADAVVSLGYITFRSVVQVPAAAAALTNVQDQFRKMQAAGSGGLLERHPPAGYSAIASDDEPSGSAEPGQTRSSRAGGLTRFDVSMAEPAPKEEEDAPPEQLIGARTVWIGLILSILLCVATIRVAFGQLVPLYATVIAVAMALVLSIMGVRALGETDLNPASGISKLAQLFFAFIVPQTHKSSVLINLIAGAVSEAGALQAGDLMQDLKTGHLLGAAPNAQFWGQVIGATVGAVVSAFIYKLYTAVYQIPGELFQVPTAYVWIFTARLVTGKGLPPAVPQWALGAAILFTITTMVRTGSVGWRWRCLIPGGIAVAVGMYNVPSFTLARALGGVAGWYWVSVAKRSETALIVLASGFILGEGFLSIVNLILQSLGAPHA